METNQNKKVLFLYCGGTIGQIPKDVEVDGETRKVLFPPENDVAFRESCEEIIRKVKDLRHFDVMYELLTTKDSSNMNPEDWVIMVERIRKAQDDEGYDAVAIGHGTDTLVHTATALAFALHGTEPGRSGLSIPVVLTGAQNSVYTDGGDGIFNLQNMFRVVDECIKQGVADVLISFWSRVLLGCRAMKVSERDFDAFQSPNYPDVGRINSLGVELRSDLVKKRSESTFRLEPAGNFSNHILTTELTPGLNPDHIEKIVDSAEIKALILRAYGAGCIPIEGKYSFYPLIKELTEKEIPVLMSSRFNAGHVGGGFYEVGLKAIEAGGIPTYDHTSVAVEIKLRWLFGNQLCNSVYGFKKAFETSYAGEVTPR